MMQLFRKKLSKIIILLVALCFLTFLILAAGKNNGLDSQENNFPPPTGKIVIMVGTVSVVRKGLTKPVPISNNMQILPGDNLTVTASSTIAIVNLTDLHTQKLVLSSSKHIGDSKKEEKRNKFEIVVQTWIKNCKTNGYDLLIGWFLSIILAIFALVISVRLDKTSRLLSMRK